jgi:hypothetical protein
LSGWVTAPRHIERISFRATLRVFDANHGGPSVSRVGNQLLSATAVHPRKTEIRGVRRQDRSAFEAAPLRRLSGKIPEYGVPAAKLYFSSPVDNHFDRTLAAVRVASSDDNRPSRKGLGARNCCHGHYSKKKLHVHNYTPVFDKHVAGHSDATRTPSETLPLCINHFRPRANL